MEIRIARPEDKSAVKELWKICFPEDSQAFVDWYFETRFRPEECLACFDGEKMLANLQMVPQALFLRGKIVPSAMIVGAATHPEMRKHGLMKELLHESFSIMAQENSASILYPFHFGFYRKMGYAVISERLLGSYPANLIPKEGMISAPNAFIKMGTYRVPGPEDVLALSSIHEQFSQRFEGRALRNSLWMRWRYEEACLDRNYALLDEGYEWYAFFSIEEDNLIVSEWAYTSQKAQKDVLKALNEQGSFKKIIAPSPIGDTLHEWLPDTRNIYSLEPFLMLRVLNPVAFLNGMQSDAKANIVLRIEDRFYKECNKALHIRTNDNYTISCELTGFGKEDVCLSVIDFARWASGQVSAKELAFEGVENAFALNFLEKKENYFYDMY